MSLLRERRRNGIAYVAHVPIRWPQVNWLLRNGYLSHDALRDDVEDQERRTLIGEALAAAFSEKAA
jgi:predicted Rdx family selenoprotein